MGYKVMIANSDRIHLATGSTGTTVAIEMQIHPASKSILPNCDCLDAMNY
jgi:hypothetical protein